MTFYVGQKVVCVETWVTNGKPRNNKINGPVKGRIYTVRSVGFLHLAMPNELCILLDELDNSGGAWSFGGKRVVWEPCFSASRFRPVVERKTDISIFTAMLDKVKA